jgi:hypothetical protein
MRETFRCLRTIGMTIGVAGAMAAITRHWSTVLNGMQVDHTGFRQETDTVLNLAAERMKAASAK